MTTTNISEVKNVLTVNNIELLSFNHSVFYDCYLSQAWFNDLKMSILINLCGLVIDRLTILCSLPVKKLRVHRTIKNHTWLK